MPSAKNQKVIYVIIGWLLIMVMGTIALFTYLVATKKVTDEIATMAVPSFVASFLSVAVALYGMANNKQL